HINCIFRSVSSADLNRDNEFANTTVSIFIYRVTANEFMRNATRQLTAVSFDAPLSLDLHFMITVWAEDHLDEHLLLAWTMRQLRQRQTLSASDLSPDGGWLPGDFVQLIPEELSSGDMMRIWDALSPKYRLSVTYVARAVRLDADLDERKPG